MPKRPRRSPLPGRASGSRPQGNDRIRHGHLPGVRIAYIGQPTAAVEEIRAYWTARGATFLLHGPGTGARAGELDCVLERADIVFLAADCVDRETERRIEVRCDRLERPMIVIDEGCLRAVEQALLMWYPLAGQ